MAAKLKSGSGKEQGGRRHTQLLGLDFASSAIKAVRLKKTKEGVALVAAEILPPCGLDSIERPELSKQLSCYYAALCSTMDNAILRVFSQTIPEDDDIEELVRENFSVSKDYRVNGMVLSRGKGKRDSALLGVAVPEKTVQNFLAPFASGSPAAHSLEISGLAAFSAFLFNRGAQTENQMVCLLETGARCTYAAFFNRNQLHLVNRFDVGGDALQRQVQLSLGVDAEMAGEILLDGSVDVTSPVRQVLNSFTRQLSIYREFVERQNKCTLSAVYMSGGQAASPYWQTAAKEVLGFVPQVWSPFEKLEILPDAFPDSLKGQEPRFAAAVGAALAGMEVA